MKKADAIVQTLLMCCSLIFVVCSFAMAASTIFYALLFQIALGLWQTGSAFFILNNKEKHSPVISKHALTYLKWGGVNVAVIFLLIFLCVFVLPLWLFFGWCPHFYYYVFTLKSAFAKAPKRRTFMDILN